MIALENALVLQYTSANLRLIIRAGASTLAAAVTEEAIDDSNVVKYLDGYLNLFCRETDHLARTIVVETNYVDRDFMREYSGFHSTNYINIPKKTTRLHFFCTDFTQAKFESWLVATEKQHRSRNLQLLQSKYLGFCVIRPLIKGYVGRTCLRTYPTEKHGSRRGESISQRTKALSEQRYYPVVTTYSVDLFGLPLTVESVAFQEQDGVVGTCATVALYSLLSGCRRRFDILSPSPLEITKLANRLSYGVSDFMAYGSIVKSLPSTGLSIEQMVHVMTENGLAPITYSTGNTVTHRGFALAMLYAYLSAGLPVLVFAKLVDSKSKTQACVNDSTHAHAFVITGFSLAPQPVPSVYSHDTQGACMLGHQINKVYVHDDQIGPFAKFRTVCLPDNSYLAFYPDAISILSEDGGVESISPYGEDIDDTDDKNQKLAVPVSLLIPVGEKLRLSFQQVMQLTNVLDGLVISIAELFRAYSGKYTWNVRLSYVDQFKKDIACTSSRDLSNAFKMQILKWPLPRMLWRITAIEKKSNNAMFEVLVDGTSSHISIGIISIFPLCKKGGDVLSLLGQVGRNLMVPLFGLTERELIGALLTCLPTKNEGPM